MTSVTPFDSYSRYYDLLYRDKDYVAETAYVDGLLREHEIAGPSLLEFGSGTGAHGRLLADLGYRVMGIERSQEMVSRATTTDGFYCEQGDICTVRLGRTFDAILSLFHVVSYQVSNQAVEALLANAAEHLRPGGLFLFDFWYSPAVLRQRPEVRVKRLEADGVEITRIAEPVLHPNENRVDVHYTIFARDTVSGAVQTFSEIHQMRHFSLPELDFVAANAGFERLRVEAFLSGAPPGEDTWGVCVVLRKIKPIST